MSETPNFNQNYDPQAFYEKQSMDLLDIQARHAAEMERTGITAIVNNIVAKKYGSELVNGTSRPVVYFEVDFVGPKHKKVHRYGINVRTKDPALIHDDIYVGSQCPVPLIEVDVATRESSYPHPEFGALQVKTVIEMAGELKEAAKNGELPNLNSRLMEINRP